MSSPNPFTPGGSINVATSTSSAATALPTSGGRQCRIQAPTGTDIVYIKFGTGASTVTTSNGMRLTPGVAEIFTVPEASTHIITIASANTPSINVTMGEGST
jgi:hypothetical protein